MSEKPMTTQQIDVWGVFYRAKLLGLFTDAASADAHKKEYTTTAQQDEYEIRQFVLMAVRNSTVLRSDAHTALLPLKVRARGDMPEEAWAKREMISSSDDYFEIKEEVIEFANILRAEANERIATLLVHLDACKRDCARMTESYAEAQDEIYAALRALEQPEDEDLFEAASAVMQQLRDAKDEAARWKSGYQGAKNATIANRTRYHQLLDLYGAADHDDPIRRLVSLGEHYVQTRDAVLKACRIIEAGDARLLASDGPAGGQPPSISLQEWREMYEALKAVQTLPNGKEDIS